MNLTGYGVKQNYLSELCRSRNLSNSTPGFMISSQHPFKCNLQLCGISSTIPMQQTLIKFYANSLITISQQSQMFGNLWDNRLLLFIGTKQFLTIFKCIITTFTIFHKRMLQHFMTLTVAVMSKMLKWIWCVKCTLLWCVHIVTLISFVWHVWSSEWWKCRLWSWFWQCVVMYIVKKISKATGSYETTVDNLHDYRVL
jgi:hypothetical protein